MARWTNVLEHQSQTNIYFDEPTNACWFVTVDGDIQQFRILGQRFRSFGSGWQDAVAVLPSTDGLHLFLVVSGGDILVVKRQEAPPPDINGVVVCDDTGNVFLEDWSGAVDPFTFNIPDTTSLCCWHSLVMVGASSSLTLIEWGEDVELLPVSSGPDPLVPSGWAPLFVDYVSAGLDHEDVQTDHPMHNQYQWARKADPPSKVTVVSGLILAGDDSRPEVVTGGNVRLVGYPVRRPEEQVMTDGQVNANGDFRLIVPSELLWVASREAIMVTVFYHGTARFIPCRSREVSLRAG